MNQPPTSRLFALLQIYHDARTRLQKAVDQIKARTGDGESYKEWINVQLVKLFAEENKMIDGNGVESERKTIYDDLAITIAIYLHDDSRDEEGVALANRICSRCSWDNREPVQHTYIGLLPQQQKAFRELMDFRELITKPVGEGGQF